MQAMPAVLIDRSALLAVPNFAPPAYKTVRRTVLFYGGCPHRVRAPATHNIKEHIPFGICPFWRAERFDVGYADILLVDPNASPLGTLLTPQTYKTLPRSLLLNGLCPHRVRVPLRAEKNKSSHPNG